MKPQQLLNKSKLEGCYMKYRTPAVMKSKVAVHSFREHKLQQMLLASREVQAVVVFCFFQGNVHPVSSTAVEISKHLKEHPKVS